MWHDSSIWHRHLRLCDLTRLCDIHHFWVMSLACDSSMSHDSSMWYRLCDMTRRNDIVYVTWLVEMTWSTWHDRCNMTRLCAIIIVRLLVYLSIMSLVYDSSLWHRLCSSMSLDSISILIALKAGLGWVQTNVRIQWNPVYTTFHWIHFCGNEPIVR